ncbi:MAG: hypothetical protein ACRDG3_02675 [Tepidiformaceae bacterium]
MNNVRDIAIALVLCTIILLYFGGACDYTFAKSGAPLNLYNCYQGVADGKVYCSGPLSPHKLPANATVEPTGR